MTTTCDVNVGARRTTGPSCLRRLSRRALVWLIASVALPVTFASEGETETIKVDLKLVTGGALTGLVVDHNEDAIVIVRENIPYVFAWDEVKTTSAYGAKLDLLVLARGGRDRLVGEDHYQLGLFALSRGRRDLAGRAFGLAGKLDPIYKDLAHKAFEENRAKEKSAKDRTGPLDDDYPASESTAPASGLDAPGLIQQVDHGLAAADGIRAAPRPPPEIRAKVMEIYRSFGRTVQQAIYKDLALIETDHFLIWTDWEVDGRDRLADWCETMYGAVRDQLDLDPADNVFLAKCPVFCWRSQSRFRRFAREFDGYDGTNAVGYTRSIEKNGHVHVVLLRQGRSEADYDRFACTLVHEGTHAVLHRVHSTRLIPHWVNEGLADLVAERVLTDRCPNAEKAELLARQYVRYDWPISHILGDPGPIGVHEYPLAQSLVAYLERLGPKRFARFIRSLKEGRTVGAAVAMNYDDRTLVELEAGWRAAVRAADPLNRP